MFNDGHKGIHEILHGIFFGKQQYFYPLGHKRFRNRESLDSLEIPRKIPYVHPKSINISVYN